MTRISLMALAAVLFLAGCGIDGEPQTPPQKATQSTTQSV